MENLVDGKTVNLNLVGINGNAFALMGAFQQQARREGWAKSEIELVLEECRSGNYNHLLATLNEHCDPVDDEDGYEEEYY